MLGQLDEAFYRNKRSALASSFALLVVTVLPIKIINSGTYYIFQIEQAPTWLFIVFVMAVCSYLNFAHVLHYLTEIPEWRRSPESGIQQAQNVQKAFEELKERGANEERQFDESLKHMGTEFNNIVKQLNSVLQVPQHIENEVVVRLGKPRGEVRNAVFNQVSSALNDPKIKANTNKNIRWDIITEDAIARVTDLIEKTIAEETKKEMERVDKEVSRLSERAMSAFERVENSGRERAVQLAALNKQLESTEKQLRNWRSFMNARLVGQYYNLPIALYSVAMAAAILKLEGAWSFH